MTHYAFDIIHQFSIIQEIQSLLRKQDTAFDRTKKRTEKRTEKRTKKRTKKMTLQISLGAFFMKTGRNSEWMPEIFFDIWNNEIDV